MAEYANDVIPSAGDILSNMEAAQSETPAAPTEQMAAVGETEVLPPLVGVTDIETAADGTTPAPVVPPVEVAAVEPPAPEAADAPWLKVMEAQQTQFAAMMENQNKITEALIGRLGGGGDVPTLPEEFKADLEPHIAPFAAAITANVGRDVPADILEEAAEAAYTAHRWTDYKNRKGSELDANEAASHAQAIKAAQRAQVRAERHQQQADQQKARDQATKPTWGPDVAPHYVRAALEELAASPNERWKALSPEQAKILLDNAPVGSSVEEWEANARAALDFGVASLASLTKAPAVAPAPTAAKNPAPTPPDLPGAVAGPAWAFDKIPSRADVNARIERASTNPTVN